MRLSIAALAVFVAASLGAAAQDPGKKKEKKTHPGLERMKKLVGTFEADTPNMGKVKVTYRLTSGGSTVMETIMPGQPHEMITMYHQDGDDFVMTHYCAIGNQPRMKAEKESKEGVVDFKCVGGSNFKCATDGHMHTALFTFKDDDSFTAEWGFMQDGKIDHAMKFDYVRQKK